MTIENTGVTTVIDINADDKLIIKFEIAFF